MSRHSIHAFVNDKMRLTLELHRTESIGVQDIASRCRQRLNQTCFAFRNRSCTRLPLLANAGRISALLAGRSADQARGLHAVALQAK